MSNITESEKIDIQFETYKFSWTAYVRPIFFMSVFSILAYLLATIEPETLRLNEKDESYIVAHPYISGTGWVLFSFFVLRLIYIVVDVRAIRLYTDEDGVWLSHGILPWNKGQNGVRWEDMDSAYFRSGFISWLFNSYRVIVTHKFTKNNEFCVAQIRHGRKAVLHINDMYKKQYMKRRDVEET